SAFGVLQSGGLFWQVSPGRTHLDGDTPPEFVAGVQQSSLSQLIWPQISDPIPCMSPNRNPAAIKAAIHFTVCSVFLAPFFTPCATFLTPFLAPCLVLFAIHRK